MPSATLILFFWQVLLRFVLLAKSANSSFAWSLGGAEGHKSQVKKKLAFWVGRVK
jgi:hypothetical protein